MTLVLRVTPASLPALSRLTPGHALGLPAPPPTPAFWDLEEFARLGHVTMTSPTRPRPTYVFLARSLYFLRPGLSSPFWSVLPVPALMPCLLPLSSFLYLPHGIVPPSFILYSSPGVFSYSRFVSYRNSALVLKHAQAVSNSPVQISTKLPP